jgi:hypothetical protein
MNSSMKVKRSEIFVKQSKAEITFLIDHCQFNKKLGFSSATDPPRSSHRTNGTQITEHRFMNIIKSPHH